jgi:cyclomaltodextrinase
MNLLGSHDTPRLLTCIGNDKASFKLSYLFLFTYPGAPTIYYGDEIGIDGAHDPYCRKSFSWDEHTWDKDLLAYTKACIALRKAYPALRTGEFNAIHVDNDTYAFERTLGGERLIVALNTAEEPRTFSFADAGNEILFGTAQIVHNGNRAEVTVGARQGIVLKGG